MDLYRFTSTTKIEIEEGGYAPAGLVVEFPAFGPVMPDTGQKIRQQVKSRYGITIRAKDPRCWFRAEKI
ncbi:MAG: hypothetical protein J1E95_07080 [Muribaculaceae bacterium]|nr:hypothetical protein [Muribaculaceae bacterium]